MRWHQPCSLAACYRGLPLAACAWHAGAETKTAVALPTLGHCSHPMLLFRWQGMGRCCALHPSWNRCVLVWSASSVSCLQVLGRPCRRNPFLDRISNPILGSSTRASFVGRQQVASGFSRTKIARIAETGEMVGAHFLLMCYCGRSKLWAAQDTQSPELRAPHFMLLRAHRLLFW